MNDRHRNRAITPRLPDDLKEQFQAEAVPHGGMNNVVVAIIHWWLRIPGAKLPPRPPRRDL